MTDSLLQKSEQCIAGVFNACGQGGERAHLHDSYSLEGIGSASVGAFVGIVAWYFTSGLLLHNFGDSGWRKMVSNVLPLPLALAAGIFASHLVNDVSDKGFTGDAFKQAMMDTGKTISDYTTLGQATFVRPPVTDDWQNIPPNNPLKPRVLPVQP